MKQTGYLLAVDQGTSGTMAVLLDTQARLIDSEDIPVALQTPHSGLVEQDPDELVRSIRTAAQRLMARHPDKLAELLGFGLANQGETFLLWDLETGRPVTPAINWQDCRAEALCSRMIDSGEDAWFHERTGLHLSPEWPALKLAWLRKNEPSLAPLWDAGRLAYGQLDAWFLYCLTGGRHYASDHSTACRSGLYNINTLDWDAALLTRFGAQGLALPKLCDNTERFDGVELGIGRRLPWVAGGLDQSMALLGQGCTEPGSAKVTYGTCCAFWFNQGAKPVLDDTLTTSVAWKSGAAVYAAAAEGGAAGSIITWLHRNFRPDWQIGRLSELAEQSESSLLFVPAFAGLGAPYWQPAARGTIFGVTAATAPEHILRAGLDAIAYTVRDILNAMPPCRTLVVDGGMCANDYLMRKQANVLGRTLLCPENTEGTVTGVAQLMRLGLGLISSPDEAAAAGTVRTIAPTGTDSGYARWKRAVDAVIRFYGEAPEGASE